MIGSRFALSQAELAAGAWRHGRIMAVTSMIYVWAYFTTVYFVTPVQKMIVPSAVMCLVFLPHGVRVLAAWLYRGRSMAYLLPGALLCNLHFAGARALDPEIVAGTLASLASAPLAFALVRRVVPQMSVAVGATRLCAVVAVGAMASVLNLCGLTVVFGLPASETAIIFAGDLSGLLLSLWLVRSGMRLAAR